MSFLRDRVKSFGYALAGLRVLISSQRNAQIHFLATLVVIVAGFYAELEAIEWAILTLTISAVVAAEALNTAIEFLADAAVPEQHPLIGKAKDVAAGAVLLTALAALVVGVLVFAPRLRGHP